MANFLDDGEMRYDLLNTENIDVFSNIAYDGEFRNDTINFNTDIVIDNIDIDNENTYEDEDTINSSFLLISPQLMKITRL